MVLGRHHGFQRKTADVIFLVAVEAVGSLVFYGTHRIVIGKIAFVLVVLGNGLGPIAFMPVGFRNQKDGFGGTLLVFRETFQHARAFFDNFFVFLRFFVARVGLYLVGDAIQARHTKFRRFVIEPFRIEHVVQIRTTGTPFQQGDKKEQRYKTTEKHIDIK